MIQQTVPTNLTPKGYQRISTATLQSLTVPTGAKFAYLLAESSGIRLRDDGTNPTTSSGYLLLNTFPFPFFYHGDLTALKAIGVSGGGFLNVWYYGYPGS